MHAFARRALAVAAAVAALLLVPGAAAAAMADRLSPRDVAREAAELAAAILSGFLHWLASAWAWLVSLDAGPLGESPGLWLVLGGSATLAALLLALLMRAPLLEPDAPPGEREPRGVDTAPGPAPAPPEESAVYRGPRDQEYGRGRIAGSRVDAASLDSVLDHMTRADMGEPRILRSLPNLMRLRLHGCRGCSCGAGGPSADGVEGCAFECGFLETSLRRALRSKVLVHEVACRARGAPACDFEVWY